MTATTTPPSAHTLATRARAREGARRPALAASPWALGLTALAAGGYVVGLVGHPLLPWWWHGPALTGVSALALVTLSRAWRAQHARHARSPGVALEAALAAVTLSFVLARTLSPLGESVYPLVYGALLLVSALVSRRDAALATALALMLELGSQALGVSAGRLDVVSLPALSLAELEPARALSRALFITLFGGLGFALHGAQLSQQRRQHREQLAQAREAMVREAREFRLIHGGRVSDAPGSREREEALILCDAVEALHHTTYVSLGLLKRALACHTCALLWYDLRQQSLHIKELVSDSDAVVEGAIDPARGVLGGVTRRREPVALASLKPGYRGLPYYHDAPDVRHFLGVPVLEQGHMRGVLCLDRIDGEPFSGAEIVLAQEAVEYILRAVQNERLFASVEKSKHELSRFFDASRQLNAALTPDEVYAQALDSITQSCPFDVAAFTTYDPATDLHTVARVIASDAWISRVKSWQGLSFKGQGGLVAMVAKNRHYLPYGGHVRDREISLFSGQPPVTGLGSLVVLPLVAQDQALGTLILGHSQPQRYPQERRETLEVVSQQIAVCLQNANLYKRMEHMATRDGLTGLPNRRHFMERFDEALARHRRSARKMAFLITDIDKFKSVNDTYGHAVGDEVLRRVSRVIREGLRETDLPGRFGGEEFVFLLEDTELDGAMILANRLREAIGREVFQSDQGPFQRTISIGVAMYPDDHDERDQLLVLADEALYFSKENGRNRVTAYSALKGKKGR